MPRNLPRRSHVVCKGYVLLKFKAIVPLCGGHTHSKMLFHNEVQEAKVAFVGFRKYVFWRSLVARLDLFNGVKSFFQLHSKTTIL